MKNYLIILSVLLIAGCSQKPLEKADFLVLHMGSPATPHLVKRIEKLGATYTIHNGLLGKDDIMKAEPKAVVITGSPGSVFDDDAPYATKDFYDLDIPVLGLCYGMQMIADQVGGKVQKCSQSEKKLVNVKINGQCGITPPGMTELEVLMDHDDCVTHLPEDFITDASSEITYHAMSCSPQRNMYLIQFHPERYDTAPESGVILDMFVNKVMKEHSEKKNRIQTRAKT